MYLSIAAWLILNLSRIFEYMRFLGPLGLDLHRFGVYQWVYHERYLKSCVTFFEFLDEFQVQVGPDFFGFGFGSL